MLQPQTFTGKESKANELNVHEFFSSIDLSQYRNQCRGRMNNVILTLGFRKFSENLRIGKELLASEGLSSIGLFSYLRT